MLNQASSGYKSDPNGTSALLVLPDWPDASWWSHLTQSGLYHCVGYYPAGSHVFNAPPQPDQPLQKMDPTCCGIVMAIIGKNWGTGMCIPWDSWPPTQPPTIPYVEPKSVDPSQVPLPAVSDKLSQQEHAEAQHLARRHIELWAMDSATGRTNLVTHRINTGDAAPIKCRPSRHSPAQQGVIEEAIDIMEAAGTIVKSKSSWGSHVVLVPKKDGGERFCIDFRPVNEVTQKDVYPLPRTVEVLDTLGTAKYFSKLDLKSGYWQIAVEPSDRHKTAFVTRRGLYEFVVMPFGLTSAPATFQRLMDSILGDLLWKTVMVYLDDIIIFTEGWQEHLVILDEVFTRLRAAGLQASPAKCELGMEQLLYLGHLITREGVLPDPKNIQTILEAAAPNSVSEVRTFLGMCNYYDEYVRYYADLAQPLYKLLRKQVEFIWSQECQDAFDKLKIMLTTAPVLRRPDSSMPYILHTDWSPMAIGAVLGQIDSQGQEHPVAYGSRLLRGAELKYAGTQGECFAVVHFVEQYRPYLYGVPFTLEVDHWALKWLMTTAHSGMLARWAMKLMEYNLWSSIDQEPSTRTQMPCHALLSLQQTMRSSLLLSHVLWGQTASKRRARTACVLAMALQQTKKRTSQRPQTVRTHNLQCPQA